METISDIKTRLKIQPIEGESFTLINTANGYLFSNHGRLWKVKNGMIPKRHLLNGRYNVGIIRDDGRKMVICVARAVMIHFVRGLARNETVIHKDGDISNIYQDNLDVVPSLKFSYNLTGLRFGRLMVKSRDIKKSRAAKKKDVQWICQCDCGNIKTVLSSALRTKETVSCGCYQREVNYSQKKHFGFGHIPDAYWGEVKRGALSRKLPLEITPEYVDALFLKQDKKCALTGEPIYFATYNSACKTMTKGTASLDRIDSTKGYIDSNVQWLHTDVNRMKLHFSQEHFVDVCRRVINHLNEK